MKHPHGKILVIRGGAIGDFILTLPVLAALRQRFAATRLELLGYPHIAQLALAGGLVDAVHPIEAPALAGFFADQGTLAGHLGDYFSEFDIILSYLYDPDGIFQANVARVSPAQFIAGPHRPEESEGLHATRVFLRPLERLALFDVDPVPRLSLGETVNAVAASASLAPIALHPGSGSERKNWPEPRWREFIAELCAATADPLWLIGGEAEGSRLERLADTAPRGRAVVLRSLPLVELAARLATCRAFVGHDSGITHLAVALGVPSLALWGPTREDLWRPQGPHLRLMRADAGLEHLAVAPVLHEFLRLPLMNAFPA